MPVSTARRPDYRSLYYPQVRYGGFTDDDQSVVFFLRVNALLPGRVKSLAAGVVCATLARITSCGSERHDSRSPSRAMEEAEYPAACGSRYTWMIKLKAFERMRMPLDSDTPNTALKV